jgi:hypothetical protein
LSERAIPVLLLKGAALAITCYEDPATRPMGDLDVLVSRAQLHEAARCLDANGFRPWSGSLVGERQSPRGHLVYSHVATGTLVELHWELRVFGRTQRRAVREIWQGARPAAVEGSPLVMRPGHALPLLCAHMLLQHREPRLIWLYDLHRLLLKMDAVEAMLARAAATRWRLGPCTALAVSRVHELFGTQIPEELRDWMREMLTRRDLQTRVAGQALSQAPTEAPTEYAISLLMGRNYSLRGILLPQPSEVRQRLGMAPEAGVGPSAYASFLVGRLYNVPRHLGQLWRFWRTAPPTNSEPAPVRSEGPGQPEPR